MQTAIFSTAKRLFCRMHRNFVRDWYRAFSSAIVAHAGHVRRSIALRLGREMGLQNLGDIFCGFKHC